MRAAVCILTPSGDELTLFAGDIIGRAGTVAMQIHDPRISEAHALVSLRGTHLKLLALRGVFAVDGKRRTEVILRPALRIELADNLFIQVLHTELPDTVLGIEGDDLARQALPGACSLVFDPRPSVQAGYVPGSAARIWGDADGWWLQTDSASARPLQPGDTIAIGERSLRAVEIPLARAAHAETRRGALRRPVRVVAQFDTVHLFPEGLSPVVLNGIQARLVSELVALGGPASWKVVAKLVWSGEDDLHLLRRRLDVALVRLRKRLRDGGVRPDLVRSGGAGSLELFLGPGDAVEDRT